jgi:predicted nuclease of predicted toxin-antitoxin system
MRFLVDECTGPAVAAWLATQGHQVFSVFDSARGATDDWVLLKAASEDWILITNDEDFGELVFREKRSHHGVIFLRLHDERSQNKIAVLEKLLERYAHLLTDKFIVVTEQQVRFAD